MQNRVRGMLLAACVLAVLSTCARPAAEVVPTATPAVCDVRVDGRWIVGPSGKPLVLYGASLPTLSEMATSGYPVTDRLRDLSAAGASLVRLPVELNEVTPTFVPAQVVPFVQQANGLGMVVVLGWSTVLSSTGSAYTDPLNTAVDDAEDWLRLEITYLSNNPGVWFDLYDGMQNVSPVRQRNIARRLVDVARGFRSNNMIVVNDPAWLQEADPSTNQPLAGGNILYGLAGDQGALTGTIGLTRAGLAQAGEGSGYDVAKYPFIVTHWDGNSGDLPRLSALQIGALVTNPARSIPAALTNFWKAHPADVTACR